MKKLLFIIFILSFSIAEAQTRISIDEALKIALKNNYDILISRKEADISKTNNTAGNAGMLPEVSVYGSGNYGLKNVHQELSDGNNSDYNRLLTTSLAAGAELSWTIFDGGKMFVTKNKLNEIEALGEIRFKEQVLQTLSEVVSAYYYVVKQKQQLNSINQTIKYNLERVTIAQTGFNSGSKKKTDLLQAKIDLNVNRENAINQEAAIISAKRELARLLVIENDSELEVSDSIVMNYIPDKSELQKKLYSQNKGILILEKQVEIEKMILKESYRAQLPKINFNAGYYFSRTSNNHGSTLLSRSIGPQVGGSISIPVFQGGDLQRQIALSKIGIESAQYGFENLKLKLNTELQNALTLFENQQQLLKIERENFDLAKENLEISIQRMRYGEATSLEVRLAQEDFEQSATRLINFQYNLKLAETNLRQLMGEL